MSENARITLAFLVGWVQAAGIYLIIKLLDPTPEIIILLLFSILCGIALYKIRESGEA